MQNENTFAKIESKFESIDWLSHYTIKFQYVNKVLL